MHKPTVMIAFVLASLLIVSGSSASQCKRPAQTLRTVHKQDVDGDGKADKLVYELKPWQNAHEGSLIITSAEGRTLWEHHWGMTKDDLEELITTEGDVTNKKRDLKSWVANFFGQELNYGAKFDTEKLKASELDDTQLDAAAKYYRVTSASLRTSILSQKTNWLVSYRAEWREDLILLVYVPSIRKFVCYQRGY